jgi:SAM-dependent methyltransferase
MMQDDAYGRLADSDRTNWWFMAKQRLAIDVFARERVRGLILDIGCGTGGNALALHDRGIEQVVGLDASVLGLEFARRRDKSLALVAALAEQLPVRDGAADGIVSMDVIEHLADDVVALRRYAAAARPGAPIVLAVPAYEWAWSNKDDRLGHRRRYTKTRLQRAIVDAGLDVERITYFHSWLAIVSFVVRKTPLRRYAGDGRDEAGNAGARVNALLRGIGAMERAVLRAVDLPFGLSLFAVARAPLRGDTRPADTGSS